MFLFLFFYYLISDWFEVERAQVANQLIEFDQKVDHLPGVDSLDSNDD